MTQVSRSKCVLITGASSGLGAELAKAIAPHSDQLVLTGRSLQKLEEVKKMIQLAHTGLSVDTFAVDLSSMSAREELIQKMQMLPLDGIFLNAGNGYFGKFEVVPLHCHMEEIEVNITANIHLAHGLLSLLVNNGKVNGQASFLQIISSHSTSMRIPNFSVYAPAKSFLTIWAQTLSIELKSEPLTVSVICPGAMKTEFTKRANIPRMISTPDETGKIALACINRRGRRGRFFLSRYDKLIQFINWFLPVSWVDALVNAVQSKYV